MPSIDRRTRAAVGVTALLMVLCACGGRLNPSEYAATAGSGPAGGSATGAAGGDAGSLGAGGAVAVDNGAATSGGAVSGGGVGGATAGAAASGGRGAGAVAAPAPAGGNGGATDVGVTATSINIANISDITGVVPGIFQSAQVAAQAYAAYVNSQGGIYGRSLNVLPYDDQEDSAQNRAAVLDACHKAFALVGGLSAFDDESPPAIQQCGIPAVPGGVATDTAAESPLIFTPGGNFLHAYPVGPAVWFAQRFPGEVKHAAMLYLNAAATIEQAKHRMDAYKSAGFNWAYTTQVSVTEPNYSPYVLQMRSQGVQWVTMQADGNSDARLLEAMQQQGWFPKVIALDQAVYSPNFLQSVGSAAEGANVVLLTSMYEDAATNPDVAQFTTWANRINPTYNHDDWGFSAWAATAMFAQAARAVGPHLTRAALLAQLKSMGTFDGGRGLIAPGAVINARLPSPCFVIARVHNGHYERADPQSGYICDKGGLFRY